MTSGSSQQRCSVCGLPLEPGAVFCAECGARTALAPPPPFAAPAADAHAAGSDGAAGRPGSAPVGAPLVSAPPRSAGPGTAPRTPRVGPAPSVSIPVAPGAVAPVGRRVLAFLVDSVLMGIVVGTGSLVAGQATPPTDGTTVSPLALLPSALALVVGVGQWVAESTRGATAGSAVMGIRTVSMRTGRPAGLLAILLRNLVIGAGALVCYVGQWVVVASGAWDRGPALRGWHDKASGTLVLRAHVPVEPAARAPRQSRQVPPAAVGGVPTGAAPTGTAPGAPASIAPARDVPVLTFPGPNPPAGTPVVPQAPVPPPAPPVDPLLARPVPSSPPESPAAAVPTGVDVPAPVVQVPFETPAEPQQATQGAAGHVAPAPGADTSVPGRRARRATTGSMPLVDVPWAVALPTATGAQPVVPTADLAPEPFAVDTPVVPVAPMTAPTAIAVPPPASPSPSSSAPAPVVAPDPFAELELTRLRAPGEATTLRLVLDTGERVDVVGDGLIGRRPDPQPGVEHVIAVDDPARSVSKVHLAFGIDADEPGRLWVMDRGSTNGSVVVTPTGTESALPPGTRAVVGIGWTVRFGERRLTVERA